MLASLPSIFPHAAAYVGPPVANPARPDASGVPEVQASGVAPAPAEGSTVGRRSAVQPPSATVWGQQPTSEQTHVPEPVREPTESTHQSTHKSTRESTAEPTHSDDDDYQDQSSGRTGQRTPEEVRVLQELRARDAEVRTHEQAHAQAGGRYAGAPNFKFTQGPDGRSYATDGSVGIDTAPVPNDPERTIAKMQTVRRAAMAPATPSAQDRQIAAQASQQEAAARQQQRAQQAEETEGPEGAEDPAAAEGPEGAEGPAAAGAATGPTGTEGSESARDAKAGARAAGDANGAAGRELGRIRNSSRPAQSARVETDPTARPQSAPTVTGLAGHAELSAEPGTTSLMPQSLPFRRRLALLRYAELRG